MSDKPIHVTRPYLPPLDEFTPYLEQIWDNHWLTNNGPFHAQLEQALCDYLDIDHISLFSSGTAALISALKALRITGDVITTPYSFVATSHALLWNDINPVFADIEPHTLNLDPARIEAAITEKTSAIMPVHCYGNSCDVEAIQAIAEKHQLKVIYDAAHAFGVEDNGGSILRHGNLSVISFHATKVFNTFEGGGIISHDAQTKQHIDYLKNFGFSDEVTVVETGINGKMSEINAAFGLLQLKYIDTALARRKHLSEMYREKLSHAKGIQLISDSQMRVSNNSYFPILIEASYPLCRDALYEKLKISNIYARRYFYPLISNMPMYQHIDSAVTNNLPVANDAAERIICLPLYPTMEASDIEKITALIMDSVNND